MVPLIFRKRALRKHGIFEITETPRPAVNIMEGHTSAPEPLLTAATDEPVGFRQFHEEMERLTKSLDRFAVNQESMSQELQSALGRLKPAPQNDLQEALTRLAGDFLPLIDLLHRLARLIQQQGNGALLETARVAADRGEAYLAALGVEVIPSVGELFDPHLHQALEARPAPPEMQGRVMEEIFRGYRMGDRVLRAALVIVGNGKMKGWT